MTHFKDYLRDLHQSDKIEQDFEDWVTDLESQSDRLWIFFKEYISLIENPSKMWKIAYIVLTNQ